MSDTDALLKELRTRFENVYDYTTQSAEWQNDKLCHRAADRIEALTAENVALKEKADHAFKMTVLMAEDAVAAKARIEELEKALIDTTASLVAAISLLKHSPKKAAPSDKMFDMMLADYGKSVERSRAALATPEGKL